MQERGEYTITFCLWGTNLKSDYVVGVFLRRLGQSTLRDLFLCWGLGGEKPSTPEGVTPKPQ